MKTRLPGAYLGVFLCIACLYLLGAGANHPFAWIFMAVLFACASIVNFGILDSRKTELLLTVRLTSYVAIFGCVVAIVLNGGTSESVSLILAAVAAALMIISALTELHIAERERT